MPRYYNDGPAVAAWHARTGEGSSTFDLCRICAPSAIAPHKVGVGLTLEPYGPGEPAGRLAGPMETPDGYEEMGGYHCAVCDRLLTARDD